MRLIGPASVLLAAAALSSCTSRPMEGAGRAVSPTPLLSGQRVAASPAPLVTVSTGLPEVVLHACGHPGSQVQLSVVYLVVPRVACDLSGVTFVHNGIPVHVPSHRGESSTAHADGPAGFSNTSLEVAANGDVTFSFRQG